MLHFSSQTAINRFNRVKEVAPRWRLSLIMLEAAWRGEVAMAQGRYNVAARAYQNAANYAHAAGEGAPYESGFDYGAAYASAIRRRHEAIIASDKAWLAQCEAVREDI